MSIAQMFDSQESVPEEQRDHAVQVGEKWLVYDVDRDPRIQPLKNAHDRVKGEARTAKEALQRWSGLGRSPDEVTEALEELETLRAGKGKTQDDLENRVKQVNEKWNGKVSELEQANTTLAQQLDALLVDDAATKAILAEKGNVELLLPHIKAKARVFLEDGRRVAKVVDKDGNPRIADVHGNPLGFDGLVKEMKQSEAFQVAFEGTGVAGSGAAPSRKPGAGSVTKRSDLKSDEEKVKFIDEHGLEAFQKLAA